MEIENFILFGIGITVLLLIAVLQGGLEDELYRSTKEM